MLDRFFMQTLDMTARGSVVIGAVILIRLLLRKTPKIYSYLLWSVVLFRLLCPVSFQAPVSMMPEFIPMEQAYTLQDAPISPFSAGVAAYEAVGDAINGGLGVQHVYTQQMEDNGMPVIVTAQWWEVWVLFGQYVWLVGMIALGAYSSAIYLKLRRRLLGAQRINGNIYLSDKIPSPFVLGLFRPRIYLPAFIAEHERSYILAHEQHHIRRFDHVFKLLGYLALMLHWFNPLVWIAYILFCKDMEMSCDEAVIRKLGTDIRADYAASLLKLAVGHRTVSVMPLAFGEGDTKERVKNMSRWKKPKLWICVAAALLIVAVAVVLATDPKDPPPEDHFKAAYADPSPVIPEEIFDIALSWAGWTGDSPVWEGCLNTIKLAISSVQHLPIYKFDTRQELDRFIVTAGITAGDSGYENIPSFHETAKKYDDAFFAENTLMLVAVSSGNAGTRYGISGIICNDASFVIRLEAYPNAGDDVVSKWFITAAVPDSMVNRCTAFDADITNINNMSYEDPQLVYSVTDEPGSHYSVSVRLPGTDLSVLSEETHRLMAEEWAKFDAMPEFDRLASSHLWGCVYMYDSDWQDALQRLNLNVKNPLEALNYLEKGNYLDGTMITQGKPRVQTTVLATASTDRQIDQVSIRTGYAMEDVRITLTATVRRETRQHTIGGTAEGSVTFSQAKHTTGSGRVAQIVRTDNAENYGAMCAYWIDGKVLYKLYLVGQPDQQEQLQKVMNKLLAEV